MLHKIVHTLLFAAFALTANAQETIVFTPQWTAQAQFTGYYVAEAKGFYREAGVKVKIEHPTPTISAMERLRTKRSQAITLQLCQALEIVDGGTPLVNILQTSMNNAMVNDFVQEVCETIGFNEPNTSDIKKAITEAVVNVIKYAYPRDTHGEVNIEAASNDMRLKFTIMDSGKPFDPTVRVDASDEEKHQSTRGIRFVRQVMDSINYERVDGMNVLTLRKKLTDIS